jgi:hypothetical protein
VVPVFCSLLSFLAPVGRNAIVNGTVRIVSEIDKSVGKSGMIAVSGVKELAQKKS